MKLNITNEQLQIDIIKESLIEKFGESGLALVEGQPSKELGEALNRLAENFGDEITLKAFNEAASMPFTGEEKTELKKAIDQGGSPDAINALVKEMSNKKDPSKKALIAKLNEDIDEDVNLQLVAELIDKFEDVFDLEEAQKLVADEIATNPEYADEDPNAVLMEVLAELDKEICGWCEEIYDSSDMHETDSGKLCDRCIDAIKSRGEDIWVKH